MTNDSFQIHYNNNPIGDSLHRPDTDTPHQESCVVDTRLPTEHTGRVLPYARTHTIGLLLQDCTPKESFRPMPMPPSTELANCAPTSTSTVRSTPTLSIASTPRKVSTRAQVPAKHKRQE